MKVRNILGKSLSIILSFIIILSLFSANSQALEANSKNQLSNDPENLTSEKQEEDDEEIELPSIPEEDDDETELPPFSEEDDEEIELPSIPEEDDEETETPSFPEDSNEETDSSDESEFSEPEFYDGDLFLFNKSSSSSLGKGDEILGTDYLITAIKNYAVSPDIREAVITTNTAAGNSQTIANVMEIDTRNKQAKIITGYGKLNPLEEGWTMETMTNQAHLYENTYNENIVGGINASFFNITTGEPSGHLVMRGNVYKNDPSRGYLASFNDGSVGIFNSGISLEQAEQIQSEKVGYSLSVEEAVGGATLLVKDGELFDPGSGNDGYYSRSAVGVKADGTVVFLQADGTMAPRSLGYTKNEEAQMMISLGCENALRLDEGGSSTFLSQRSGESDLTMRNVPAGGSERVVSGSIFVVSQTPPTGEFENAIITPNAEVFTPDSTINLTALGVDASGAQIDKIPNDVSWRLSEESLNMGTITNETIDNNKATAQFQAKNITGEVVIQLVYEDSIYGSTTFYIQEPDNLYFISNEINLDYGEVSDLGLRAKYNSEIVNLKDGDIQWEIGDETAGNFDGIKFNTTENKKVSVSTTVTAKYGELEASSLINIGKQPQNILDGGDEDGLDYSNIGDTVHDFTGLAKDAIATYSYAGRGGVVKGSVVSDSDPEFADIVRFGNKAIKLEYDWSKITGTDGACLGLGDSIDIPGTPSALGAWVYMPEGMPVPWFRAQISTSQDGKTYTNAYINFNEEGSDSIVSGWQYLEADLTQYAGQQIRINSGMLFRAMVLNNVGGMGWKTTDGVVLAKEDLKGYFLLDNVQFVYGSNNQDVTNPTISSIELINTDGSRVDLENGTVIDENSLNFFVTYNDNEDTDDFATGIESAYFYFDGINFGEGQKDHLGSTFAGAEFANGEHSITFYVKDGFGNVTRQTRYFTIKGNEKYTNMEISTGEIPILGGEFSLDLTSNQVENISSFNTTINFSGGYTIQDVVFSNGFTGNYTTNPSQGILTIKGTGDGSANDALIAKILLKVGTDVSEGASVGVQVNLGNYEVFDSSAAQNSELWAKGFSSQRKEYMLEAMYRLNAEPLIYGQSANIFVSNTNGDLIDDVSVYYNDDILLGTSDKNGIVVADELTEKIEKYTLYAKDNNGNYSFPITIQCTEPIENKEGYPYYILMNSTSDPYHNKNITWLSSPNLSLSKAMIEYSQNEDLSDAIKVEGRSNLVTFSGNAKIVRSNGVVASNLKTNSTYYFRVGDGEKWSEILSFNTSSAGSTTDFYIIADIQEDDAVIGFGNIVNLLKQHTYDFGIQTGDAVDNVRFYNQWEDTLSLFDTDGINRTDVIHVIGNHEADDDNQNAYSTKNIFGIEDDWYSVEYGNVYIAVLNHTMEEEKINAFKDWLIADAAKSTAKWKIFTTHVPVYYTNPTGGGQVYNKLLPDALEQAGINFAFAGNDHSYARTLPMTGGEVDEDDGIVYFIAGSTGGKSYSVVDKPEFNFDIASINFNSIYMTVSASETEFLVTAYDVDKNGNATVFDQYEKSLICEDDNHNYEYDKNTDLLTCSRCGESIYASVEKYNGWAKDKQTKRAMYFVAGKETVGSIRLEDGFYYFDDDALAIDGEIEIAGEICEFTSGKFSKSTTNSQITNAGFCGKNIGFIIEDKEQLTISGEGRMYDYTSYGLVPWGDEQKIIQSVIVEEGITSLGDFSFFGMSAIRNFSLPESLRKIGAQTFRFASKLSTLRIPDGVAFIDPIAFYASKDPIHQVTLDVAAGSCAESYAITKKMKVKSRAPSSENLPISTGLVWFDKDLHYVKDGVPQYGLILAEDDQYYYFSSMNYKAQKGKVWTTFTHDTGIKEGFYQFGEDYAMINPPEKPVIIPGGLTLIDNKYYYINEENGNYETGKVYVNKTNGYLITGYYYFADDGHMYDEEIGYSEGQLHYFNKGKIDGYGLMKIGNYYYYISTSDQRIIVSRTYWITAHNNLLKEGLYQFDDSGKLCDNGYFLIDGNEVYYDKYKPATAPDPDPDPDPEFIPGLVFEDGKYYYREEENVELTGKVFVSLTNGLLPTGYYYFSSEGYMLDNVVYSFDDLEYHYYVKGKIKAPGLVNVEGHYYYISTSNSKAITGRQYWITAHNNLLSENLYYFADDGKLADNGYYTVNGVEHYFEDYKISIPPTDPDPDPEPDPVQEGLVLLEDKYYYLDSTGQKLTGLVDVSITNGLMLPGQYYFGSDGHLLNCEVAPMNGDYYYFEMGRISGLGLIFLEGDYYYVSTTNLKIIVNRKYWITLTNDLLPATFYEFDAQGKMIRE